jgi:putative flippase GtrA
MADDGEAAAAGMIRFAKYAATGVVTNLLAYTAFIALLWSAVPPTVASAGAYAVGLTLSYLANRRWAFRGNAGHRRDLPRFGVAYGIGLGYTMAAMEVLSRVMPPEVAQVLVILSCAGVIYAGLVLLRFGR